MKLRPLTNFPSLGVFCCDCGEFLGFSCAPIENAFCKWCVQPVRDLFQVLNFPDPIPNWRNITDYSNRIGMKQSINMNKHLFDIRTRLRQEGQSITWHEK